MVHQAKYLSIISMLLVSSIGHTASAGSVTMTTTSTQRCISANGIPDHSTGTFPNQGNPHSLKEQNIYYCFPLNPQKNQSPIPQRGSIGVALNGITIRPGTADYWDASSHRGHSRDRSSGWNLEGLGSREALGMDQNNAHVDNTGLYHYHGVANALVQSTSAQGTLIGYAADGFEIHYIPSTRSSYRLKSGTRPSGPGGTYDGSYNEDWEYIPGSSSLDQCNGGTLNGQFIYFATDTYPFFPRCLWGATSTDFGVNSRTTQPTATDNHKPVHRHKDHSHSKGGRKNPPPEAISACNQKSTGSSCSFSLGHRSLYGQCRHVPTNQLACVPSRH